MSKQRVRALIIVEGKLLLFQRIRPGVSSPYHVTPGGGIEPSDKSEHDALLRELKEELGVASANVGKKLFTIEDDKGNSHTIYECTIGRIQLEKRTGPEFLDPQKGSYEIVWIPLDEIEKLELRPAGLKEAILRKYVATQHLRHTH